MVTVIDYGIGNLRSIEKALEAIGVEVLRTDRPADLLEADHLVLPGVGAFGACIAEIRRRGLEEPIKEYVASGRPFIGVCVGMQLLFTESEERGHHRGLDLLPGRVVRFEGIDEETRKPLKVPHMGWNTVAARYASPLLEELPTTPFFYFVHSYHPVPGDEGDILATSPYGTDFASIVHRDNVYGVQFHPEKSQRNGLQVLKNFAGLHPLN